MGDRDRHLAVAACLEAERERRQGEVEERRPVVTESIRVENGRNRLSGALTAANR